MLGSVRPSVMCTRTIEWPARARIKHSVHPPAECFLRFRSVKARGLVALGKEASRRGVTVASPLRVWARSKLAQAGLADNSLVGPCLSATATRRDVSHWDRSTRTCPVYGRSPYWDEHGSPALRLRRSQVVDTGTTTFGRGWQLRLLVLRYYIIACQKTTGQTFRRTGPADPTWLLHK